MASQFKPPGGATRVFSHKWCWADTLEVGLKKVVPEVNTSKTTVKITRVVLSAALLFICVIDWVNLLRPISSELFMARLLPVFCLFTCFSANAALLLQRVPLDLNVSHSLDSENSPFVYEYANPFTLNTTETIRQVVVWGRTSSTATPTFTVRLYADAAGTPNTTPVSEQSVVAVMEDTGQRYIFGPTNQPIYKIILPLTTPIAVNGATNYHFSVFDNTPNLEMDLFQHSNTTVSIHNRNGDNYATPWNSPVANSAIAVELRSETYAPPAATAVPTLPLFGLLTLGGLLGLFGLRKLKK